MWNPKKPESPDRIDSPFPASPGTPREATPAAASACERAVIGPSISVKGEITGAEDLLVQGFVDGTVNLKQNVVTVGKSGRVNANVYGRVIHVEGEVTGDCYGTEQVIVHKSGTVRGNITAPRVTLEDGARLKGAIDTSVGATDSTASSTSAREVKAETKTESKQPQQPAKRDSTTATAAVQ